MALSFVTYAADGVATDFLVPFDYLEQAHVQVTVDKVPTTAVGSLYTFEWLNDNTIRVRTIIDSNPAPGGAEIQFRRQTPIDTPAVVFGGGASLSSANLNKNSEYLTFALQEATDDNEEFTKLYLGSKAEEPTVDNDGDTLQVGAVYYDVNLQALYYWTGSEWIVGESTLQSQAAATEAQAALDSFTDLYLGAKASAPTVDNDGDALQVGALYFDTGVNVLFTWDGSVWLDTKVNKTGDTMTGDLEISKDDPALILTDTGGTANDRRVRFRLDGNRIRIEALTDGGASETIALLDASTFTLRNPDGTWASLNSSGTVRAVSLLAEEGVFIRTDGTGELSFRDAAENEFFKVQREGTDLYVYKADSGANSRRIAKFDDTGLTLSSAQSVVTREKGDERYELKGQGGGPGGGASSLNDLTDVDLETFPPTDGEFLVYDAIFGVWSPEPIPAIPTDLVDLTDVDLSTAPTDGQSLVFDAASGTWMAGTITGGGGASALDDLTDVDLSVTPTDNQALVYDAVSGNWLPGTVSGPSSGPIPVEPRFWRLRFTNYGVQNGFVGATLAEIEGYEGLSTGPDVFQSPGASYSASQESFGSTIGEAFDEDNSTWWGVEDNVVTAQQTVTIDLGVGNGKWLDNYALTARTLEEQMFRGWVLEYSTDNATWSVADVRPSETGWGNNERRVYSTQATQPTLDGNGFTGLPVELVEDNLGVQSGYQVVGDVMTQWGTVSSDASGFASVVFPVAFGDVPTVVATAFGGLTPRDITVHEYSAPTTAAVFLRSFDLGVGSGPWSIKWVAMGEAPAQLKKPKTVSGSGWVQLTQAEYNALTPPDPNTLYLITG